MNSTYLLRIAGVALALVFALPALAEEETKHYFLNNPCWVCASPEAYSEAIAAQKTLSDGKTIADLEKELFDRQLCVFLDSEEIEGLTSPYLTIVDSQGDMSRVTFVIKFENRIALLNRELEWYKFNGWTEFRNLKELW